MHHDEYDDGALDEGAAPHQEFLRNEANRKNLNDFGKSDINGRENGDGFYGTNPIDRYVRQSGWVPWREGRAT